MAATRTTALCMLLILTVALSACGPFGNGSPSAKATPTMSSNGYALRHPFKFAFVVNGPVKDPFWSMVKKGAYQAGKDMGVAVTYAAPGSDSVAAMSELIDAAVAARSSGLVVSIADCNGLTPAIQRAQLVGIPVISISSGSECATKLGLLNYIGQTDYDAGLSAGAKLADAGATHVLCVNAHVGNPDLDDRCRGIKDAMVKAGGKSDTLALDLSNSNNAQQTILARLTQDPSLDGVITLDATSAALATAASQHLIRTQHFFLATFDLSPAVFQAIQQGNMLFAVDQQPYLQGYLPVVLLTLYQANDDVVASQTVSTGPLFVTSANVSQVKQADTENGH